jgi:hypothetical protein
MHSCGVVAVQCLHNGIVGAGEGLWACYGDGRVAICEHYIGPFGGNVSVRCPAGSKPLIIFGQDESIFNQFSHSGK